MSPSPVDSPAAQPSRWSARLRRWAPSVAAAAVAFVVVLCQLDPGGADPGMPQGPGLTVDEGFYTQQGVYLAAARHFGLALLDPRTLGEIFDTDAGYMADHPPLAKLWLGLWHDFAWWAHAPESPGGPFSVARARVGSAAAFALTVGLLVGCGTRWYGLPTGLAAGASLALMPRVFGHAHIASLETVTNLFFTACLCGVAAWWNPRVTTFRRPALCGLLFGLALLCKIQGALIGPTVAVWALYHAGREHGWKDAWRAIGPVAVFGGVGLCVFFVGWPYLWLNPSEHGAAFLDTITDRLPIRNYYLGEVWNDEGLEATPWHYPLVLTLATVPVGLTGLAVYGAWRGGVWGGVRGEEGGVRSEALGTAGSSPPPPPSTPLTLFTAAVFVPLALVSTRGESLYDGVRLWLVIFPPLALLAGRGAGLLYDRLKSWRPKLAAPAVIGLLAVQGVNVIWMSPVWLSSYSAVVGGLWGADRLGFERNYWGDAVTRELIAVADEQMPPDTPFFVAPTLHQFSDRDRAAASPLIRQRFERYMDARRKEWAAFPGGGGFDPRGPGGIGTVRFARLAWWSVGVYQPERGNYEMRLLIDRAARHVPQGRSVRRQGVVLAIAADFDELPELSAAETYEMADPELRGQIDAQRNAAAPRPDALPIPLPEPPPPPTSTEPPTNAAEIDAMLDEATFQEKLREQNRPRLPQPYYLRDDIQFFPPGPVSPEAEPPQGSVPQEHTEG